MISLDDELFEALTTGASRGEAALLCWHRLYGWPALHTLARRWPPLRLVP